MAGASQVGVPIVPGLDGLYMITDTVGTNTLYGSGDPIPITINGQGVVDMYSSFVILPAYEKNALATCFIDNYMGLIDQLILSCNGTLFFQCQRYGLLHVALSKTRSLDHRNGVGLIYDDGTPVDLGTDLDTMGTTRPLNVFGSTATATTPLFIMLPLYYLLPLVGGVARTEERDGKMISIPGYEGMLYCDGQVEWKINITTNILDQVNLVCSAGSGVLQIAKPQLYLTRLTSESIVPRMRSLHQNGQLTYGIIGLRCQETQLTAAQMNVAQGARQEFTVNGAVIGFLAIMRLATSFTVGATGYAARTLTLFDDGNGLNGYQYGLPDGTTYPLTTKPNMIPYTRNMCQQLMTPQIRKFNSALRKYFYRPDEMQEPFRWGESISASAMTADMMYPLIFPYVKSIGGICNIQWNGTGDNAARYVNIFIMYRGTLRVLPGQEGCQVSGYTPAAA
jgi:hypothetical protein